MKEIEIIVGKEFVNFDLEEKLVQIKFTQSGQRVTGLMLEGGIFRVRSTNKIFYKSLDITKQELKKKITFKMQLDLIANW